MYAADLATSCQVASGPHVRAIGWLEREQPYTRGAVDPRVASILRAIIADAGRFLPVASFGFHSCDLGNCAGDSGAQHVVIPSPTCVYVAPDLVVHYIESHMYAPPAAFADAVLSCPEQCSDAYVDLVLPFASTWRLDTERLRALAAQAPEKRRSHAEYVRMLGDKPRGFPW